MFRSCSGAAQAGARQVRALPTACLRCCRAKSTSTGAVPGGDGGQAGVVPGHGEEAVSSPWHCSPALQPNHLLSWHLLQRAGPGGRADRPRRLWPPHPGEHPARVGPGCQHGQGLVSGSITPWGSRNRCPALAQILLCLPWDASGCCGRRQGAAGPALLCRAGCGVWAGCPAACLGLGTGLTSSLGPSFVLHSRQHWPRRGLPATRSLIFSPGAACKSCLPLAKAPCGALLLTPVCRGLCLGAEGQSIRAAPVLSKLGKGVRPVGWMYLVV